MLSLSALYAMAPVSLRPAIRNLLASDPAARIAAARAIAEAGFVEAAPVLEGRIREGEPDEAWEFRKAIQALKSVPSSVVCDWETASDELIGFHLRNSDSVETRLMAVNQLVARGSREHMKQLEPALHDADPRLRLAALRGLYAWAPDQAIHIAEQLFTNAPHDLKLTGARVLAEAGGDHLDTLVQHLAFRDAALTRLGYTCRAAAEVIAATRFEEIYDRCVLASTLPERFERRDAALKLGALGSVETDDGLEAARSRREACAQVVDELMRDDRFDDVRLAAAASAALMGMKGWRAAVEGILEAISPDTAKDAFLVLVDVGGPESAGLVGRCLRSLNPGLRVAAVEEIARTSPEQVGDAVVSMFRDQIGVGKNDIMHLLKRVSLPFGFVSDEEREALSRFTRRDVASARRAAATLVAGGRVALLPELVRRLDIARKCVGVLAETIHGIAPEITPTIGAALLDGDTTEEREAGADLLARVGGSSAELLRQRALSGRSQSDPLLLVCGDSAESNERALRATAAVHALGRWRGDETVDRISEVAASATGTDRLAAIHVLAGLPDGLPPGRAEARADLAARCVEVVRPYLDVKSVNTQLAALAALAQLGWEGWKEHAHGLLSNPLWAMRQRAIALLGARGDRDDADALERLVADPREHIRTEAADALIRIAPDRAVDLAVRMLDDKAAADAAARVIVSVEPTSAIVDRIIACLDSVDTGVAKKLLEHLGAKRPDRLNDAVASALSSPQATTRIAALEMLDLEEKEYPLSLLRQIVDADNLPSVHRTTALEKATALASESEIRDIALSLVGDDDYAIRRDAAGALEPFGGDDVLDAVLPLARDGDEEVRAAAIQTLAKFDDPRVLGEIVSSLNDVDASVSAIADQLLRKPGKVRALRRVTDDPAAFIARMRMTIRAITHWAWDLGFLLLGRPANMTQLRQGLGRTGGRGRSGPIEIEVSDTPLTSGHPHGEEIMKGLAAHEIGHHVCDIGARGFSTTRGIARSEGLEHIYSLLIDERLERSLRSLVPELGVYFDRLASYAFAQSQTRLSPEEYAELVGTTLDKAMAAVEAGRKPGRLVRDGAGRPDHVLLDDKDIFAIPRATPPLIAFMSCLRCGFDPRHQSDPRVAQAIALVPANLKDIPHAEVLEAARRIGDVIGRDKQHARAMSELLRTMRSFGNVLRRVRAIMERLADTGHLPDPKRPSSAGIRGLPGDNGPQPPSSSRLTLPRNLRRGRDKRPGGKYMNIAPGCEFDRLEDEVKLDGDPAAERQLVAQIRPHVRKLRSYLERLGRRSVDEYASRRGPRLDMGAARGALLTGRLNILVHTRDEILADAYLGLLIDRSGSMAGDNIERAKLFGTLLAESARGIRGLTGHVNAFDDDEFVRLGDFQRHAIAALEAGGGNNDSGALLRAAELAAASGKRNRLIVMVSDGSPSACSFKSLENLVATLIRQHGFALAQVAVESLPQEAFPVHVDLSALSMEEAVARFGRLLMALTAAW